MKSRTQFTGGRRGQRGFGMAIALAVLAVFALIAGAIALANKGGAQKTDLETAKAMAQSIVTRGNEIYTAAIRVGADRDLTKMTLDATTVPGTSFGLYDPTIGVAQDVAIPGKALVTNVDTSMVLNKTDIKIVGIGTGGTDQLAVTATLVDVTLPTCQLINKTIYSDAIDATPPTVSAATAITRTEGCAVINAKNTYYKVLASAV